MKKMANKLIAVFLVCIVLVAAVQVPMAGAEDKFDERYKSCFSNCDKECKGDGQGSSFCEVKCDEDCSDKEVADKLNIKLN